MGYFTRVPGGTSLIDGAEAEALARARGQDHPVRHQAPAEVARLEVARDDDALVHEILRGEALREARDDAPGAGLVADVDAQLEELVLPRHRGGRR